MKEKRKVSISISSRAAGIKESPTMAITAKAKAMQKSGINVIGFGAGEPDFPTPGFIIEAAKKALDEGATRYTPAAGTPELKAAVCEWMKNEIDVSYEPSEIVVSCGAKHSLYNLMLVLFQEGDEVILPSPYWVSYPDQISLAGASTVIAETTEESGFKISAEMLESLVTERTRGLILNSPSNPTGMVYSRDDLEAIAEVCVRHNIVVISDEIYSRLLYNDVSHVSIASISDDIRELTMVVNGVSKAYSMTGWRIGWAAGNRNVMKASGNIQSQSTSNPTTVAQAASIAALAGDQSIVDEMRREFDTRRKLMVDLLNDIPGVTCKSPEGAFYCFANVSGLYGSSLAGVDVTGSSSLAEVCLDKAKIAIVSGDAFGADDFVRLSYATSRQKIEDGLARFRALVCG